MERVYYAVGVFTLAFGLTLIAKPRQSIELQIRIYRVLNWRMEPLDWKREIHSTRIMGVICVACALATMWLIGA